MSQHYFYGKKEHSITYAAASFFMPTATARVEAIRVMKGKLKHSSPPRAPDPPSATTASILAPLGQAASDTPSAEPAQSDHCESEPQRQENAPFSHDEAPTITHSGEDLASNLDVHRREASKASQEPRLEERASSSKMIKTFPEGHEEKVRMSPEMGQHSERTVAAKMPDNFSDFNIDERGSSQVSGGPSQKEENELPSEEGEIEETATEEPRSEANPKPAKQAD